MLQEIENTETALDRLIQRIYKLSDGKINTISILAYRNKEIKLHIEFFEGEGIDIIKNPNGDWELLDCTSDWKSIARVLSIENILKQDKQVYGSYLRVLNLWNEIINFKKYFSINSYFRK